LSITSCGGHETVARPDSGGAYGSTDGSGRDALRLDGPNAADLGIPAVEAGIPDAVVRLDVQTTPDVVTVDAPVVNGDVYVAPVDVSAPQPEVTPALTDAVVFTRDTPSLPDLPDAVDLSLDRSAPVDLAIDGPTPVDLAMDGPEEPEAAPDVPLVLQGTGGTSGGGILTGPAECYVPSNCTPPDTTCKSSICNLNTCGVVNAPLGTPCQDNGGAVCDGNGSCSASHCSDGVQDADETDVDCGGSCGPTCQYATPQQKCNVAGDCVSGVCGAPTPSGGTGGSSSGGSGGVGTGGSDGGIDAGGSGQWMCQPPTCFDGVHNGDETDVDCGGSCGATCQYANPQQKCKVPGDCVSGVCAFSAPAAGAGGSDGGSDAGGAGGGVDGGIDGGAPSVLMCQPVCQGNATQCSGNALQTCTSGTWGVAVACGPLQTCTGLAGTAQCTCNADPVCITRGGTCATASTLTTCALDNDGCFYALSSVDCTNGACSGSAGSASCCTNACTAGATACFSSTQLGTCALGANGCASVSAAATCATGLVCERWTPVACADPNWDQWPLPNSQADVTSGAPNLENYTDNQDGTVTDNVTGLMWQQAVPSDTSAWVDAVAFCSTLPLAGHNDWRLPSFIELESIVDYGQFNPSINGAYFPSTPSLYFWSSSSVAGSPSNAWFVNFYLGTTLNSDEYESSYKSASNYVRCVR
jgi:hypothetical protein